MKKKITPAEQTKKLRKARWEFLKRNAKAKEDFENQEIIKSFREWFEKHPDIFNNGINSEEDIQFYKKLGISPRAVDSCDELLECTMQRPAAEAVYHFFDFINKHPRWAAMPDDEINGKWLNFLIKKAKETFHRLTYMKPIETLLLGVDMTRSKDVIMAEVERLVDKHQKFYEGQKPVKTRLKWLPLADELIQIWDLYQAEGKTPGTVTFKIISKKLKLPVSTIKSRWYTVYEKIYGIPYDPEIKISTEEKKAKADELCIQCPYGAKCYRSGDWFPCAEYMKIAGKEKINNDLEFKDEIYIE
jgi:hypothetical protein